MWSSPDPPFVEEVTALPWMAHFRDADLTMSGITFYPHQWHAPGKAIASPSQCIQSRRSGHSEKTPVRAAIMKAAVSAK